MNTKSMLLFIKAIRQNNELINLNNNNNIIF